MDQHKDNKEVSDMIYFKIKDPRFRKYYNFLGTSGCSARTYRNRLLELGMLLNTSKESELSGSIYNKFQPNSRYTSKEIKLVLQDIYKDLGITSIPKATDLGGIF